MCGFCSRPREPLKQAFETGFDNNCIRPKETLISNSPSLTLLRCQCQFTKEREEEERVDCEVKAHGSQGGVSRGFFEGILCIQTEQGENNQYRCNAGEAECVTEKHSATHRRKRFSEELIVDRG